MAEAPAGAIRFDTSIDTKGIEEGVKKMQSAIADGSKKSAKNLDDVDKSAQDLGKSLKIKPEGMEKLERELDNINGQIEIQERLLDGMRASYRRLSDIGLGDSDQGLRLSVYNSFTGVSPSPSGRQRTPCSERCGPLQARMFPPDDAAGSPPSQRAG